MEAETEIKGNDTKRVTTGDQENGFYSSSLSLSTRATHVHCYIRVNKVISNLSSGRNNKGRKREERKRSRKIEESKQR